MTTSALIAIVFKLINFGVVIGLIAYLFKTRVLPMFLKKITESAATKQALQLQQEQLELRHQELVSQLAAQEIATVELKKRVDRWHKVVDKENNERRTYEDEQRAVIQKKVIYRSYEIERAKAYKQVVRSAVAHAKKEMEQALSNDQKSAHYFAHLINSLAERE